MALTVCGPNSEATGSSVNGEQLPVLVNLMFLPGSTGAQTGFSGMLPVSFWL